MEFDARGAAKGDAAALGADCYAARWVVVGAEVSIDGAGACFDRDGLGVSW